MHPGRDDIEGTGVPPRTRHLGVWLGVLRDRRGAEARIDTVKWDLRVGR